MKKNKNVRVIYAAVLALAIAGFFLYNYALSVYYKVDYTEYVEKYCEQYNLDVSLVYAVIKCESSFNTDAKSPKDAYGLMQIKKTTMDWVATKIPVPKEELSVERLYEPEFNIMIGTHLLKMNLDTYGDEETALAAYNAGRGAVDGWLKDSRFSQDGKLIKIPYPETQKYVERVKKAKEYYQKKDGKK